MTVGDGKQIEMWKDKWLRKPSDYKAQQLDTNQSTLMKVDRLMDGGRMVWNMTKVKEVLIDQDATLVEKIPLSRISRPDKLIWRDFIVGTFSVRSAYYKARKVLGRECLERAHREKIWYRIWTARTAPKIKFFIWRLIQNVIPTKVNLQGKGIQVNG